MSNAPMLHIGFNRNLDGEVRVYRRDGKLSMGTTVAGYKAEYERAMQQARAEAWDEGFADGMRQDAEGEDGPKFTNPYREAPHV